MGSVLLRVEVEWLDSGEARDNGWESRETVLAALRENVPAVSVGWLIHEDPEQIVIAHTHDPKNDIFLGGLAIHRANILRISVLRVRKDYDAKTFSENEAAGPSTRDSSPVRKNSILRSAQPVVSSDNIHWQVLGGSEDEAEVEGIGHLQRALQRLGVGRD